ncbi:MAG: TatD family hydrolase, partial [Opitutaceae bacterium]
TYGDEGPSPLPFTMPRSLYDAHCHLADARLAPFTHSVQSSLEAIGCKYSVVNGTSPADWQAVLDYAKTHSNTLPAIGLHPWQVNTAPGNWQVSFLEALNQGVRIIGEIGLDQWIDGHDIEAQKEAFRRQLAEATRRNLPVSIHCLKAIDPLMDTLLTVELPKRGIHIHALNVSVKAASKLIQMGSYFSFNAGQLKPKAKHIYNLIRAVPDDRILIETDAPDFLPAEQHRRYTLEDTTLNHPANLRAAYEAIAKVRQVSFEELRDVVAANFKRYFID